MVRDSNGRRVRVSVKREGIGWGANVWFGGMNGLVTNVRRYVYRTRRQARKADISHDIGQHGRIG